MTFIEKVDLLRRVRGFSERSLASELGINPSAISRWRSRNSIPRPEIVKGLADLFGITPVALVDAKSPLPHQALTVDLRAAASKATALFPADPVAGQIAFEKFTGERATKIEKIGLAEFLRGRAASLRKEAASLERKAKMLES